MVVRLHKNQLAYFRRKAKKNPNEILAILLGKRVAPHLIEVYEFHYPKLAESTPTAVRADYDSHEEIADYAKECGLTVVGSIHSHPCKDAAIYMSKQDKQSHLAQGDHITGICEVTAKRTYVAFWIPNDAVPCERTYF